MSVKLSCSTIIETGDSFLLVAEGKKGPFGLPGGGPKKRESLAECAIRETREETGLQVVLGGLVGIYQCRRTRAGNNVTRAVFSATRGSGIIEVSTHHPLVTYFDWQAVQDLGEYGLLANDTVLTAITDYRAGEQLGLETLTLLPDAGSAAAESLVDAAMTL